MRALTFVPCSFDTNKLLLSGARSRSSVHIRQNKHSAHSGLRHRIPFRKPRKEDKAALAQALSRVRIRQAKQVLAYHSQGH